MDRENEKQTQFSKSATPCGDGGPRTREELRAYLAASRAQRAAARDRTLAAIARLEALKTRG